MGRVFMGTDVDRWLVAFDFDGVIVDCSSSWEFIHQYFEVSNEESHQEFKNGTIDDMEFIRRDVALWEGVLGRKVRVDDIMPVIENIPVRPGAIEVLKELKSRNHVVGIISGGLQPAVDKVAELAGGLDFSHSNWLEIDGNGEISGRGIIGVSLWDKATVILKEQKRFDIEKSRTASIGDSYVDIGLFENSGLKIAFNPSSKVLREMADHVIEDNDIKKILEYIP